MLNAMCDRLVSARRGLEEESTARVEVLEQLRHLDRLRTVGTLASSLAHELGTPLNILLIRGQSLRDEKLDSGEVSEAGATVVSQVEKMRRIVQQLLDFARRRPPIRSEVRLSEVASRAKHLLSAMARKHGVEIELDVKTDASTLGDPTQLEQAVTNLMLNGIQAMTEGGVLRLEVRSEDSALAPNSSRPIRVGVLDTQDQGPGIGADELARIFEPFYTTKPEGSGTGLGLGVASGIAAEHGGWIKAASERGKGSSFALYLPRIT